MAHEFPDGGSACIHCGASAYTEPTPPCLPETEIAVVDRSQDWQPGTFYPRGYVRCLIPKGEN